MATVPAPIPAKVTAPLTGPPGQADVVAAERAARRLSAWQARHPDAADLACLASLAVRIDSALLRRLRLQLLPRTEPGIEADVWFSGLHESRGRDGIVLDAGVQRLLRERLVRGTAGVDGARLLEAAWRITAALHAELPEALRTEELLTVEALRGGADLPARIDALLAPALAAMAGGGDARALEIARWAQRAVPRLPDAARTHPSALALWLAALLRLGLPAARLPDTGEAGLPPALQWLLPAGQMATPQRLALTAFGDALQCRPLADAAPAEPTEIQLPRTGALLLALIARDAAGAVLLQRTVALDAAAVDSRLPLPAAWKTLELHSLTGARWRLLRTMEVVVGEALDWRRLRVRVEQPGAGRPVGMATFVAPAMAVTVLDVLEPDQIEALRSGRPSGEPMRLYLEAREPEGGRRHLSARLAALDLRSSLVLLDDIDPSFAAQVPSPSGPTVAEDSSAWTLRGVNDDGDPVDGRLHGAQGDFELPAGRPMTDALSEHIGLTLQPPAPELAGNAGAPVFVGQSLAGIVDLGMQRSEGQTLWLVPTTAIRRLLDWAQRPADGRPMLLLHHPADDPKGTDLDERAVEQLQSAAQRSRVRLVLHAVDASLQDDDAPWLRPGLAGAVRLVTPVTKEAGGKPSSAASLRLCALAARHWAQPGFELLNLGFRMQADHEKLPPALTGLALQNIERVEPEALARLLLDLADPPPVLPAGVPLRRATHAWLKQSVSDLARPFAPSPTDLETLLTLVDDVGLTDIADRVASRWNVSSRIDPVPFVEALTQLALPLHDDGLLDRLRLAPRGALVLNAMPAQFGRLLVARAHAGLRAPPCVVVREQTWQATRSVDAIEAQVLDALGTAVACTPDDARTLLARLDLSIWVLVTTRPLPDRDTLLALELRMPSIRWLFLAGPDPDLAASAEAIGATLLPPLPDRADMRWLQGYKRLMQWARPRRTTSTRRTGTKAQPPRRPLPKKQ